MKIIPDYLTFDRDEGNKSKNYNKHSATVEEIEDVFEDESCIIFEDDRHSTHKKRYGLFGQTKKQRKLSIAFTIRNNQIRPIMARDMSKNERSIYEAKN